jgi:hypothetical protein
LGAKISCIKKRYLCGRYVFLSKGNMLLSKLVNDEEYQILVAPQQNVGIAVDSLDSNEGEHELAEVGWSK